MTQGMDEFETVKTIGRGAFGEVELVRRRGDGKFLAVKRIRHAGELVESDKVLKEVRVLQSMQHPNILRFYGSVDDGDTLCLITEFADSGDLQQLLRKRTDADRRFEDLAALSLFTQLADAVRHVHSKRVLHRDLKPSNVLLTSEGLVKLGDFGVAKVIAGTAVYSQMTCVGSPVYMAPEVVNGEMYGPACDIWSLGVILYELCTLRKPFQGRSLGEVAMRILHGEYVPLDKAALGALAEFAQPILDGALVLEAAKRASVDTVVNEPVVRMLLASPSTARACVAEVIRDPSGEAAAAEEAAPGFSSTAMTEFAPLTPAANRSPAGGLAGQLGATVAALASTVRHSLDGTSDVADVLGATLPSGGVPGGESGEIGDSRPPAEWRDAQATLGPGALEDLLKGALQAEYPGMLESSQITKLDAITLQQMSHFARAAFAGGTVQVDAYGEMATLPPVGLSGSPKTPPEYRSESRQASPQLDPRDTQQASRVHRLDRGAMQANSPVPDVQDERQRQRLKARETRRPGTSHGAAATSGDASGTATGIGAAFPCANRRNNSGAITTPSLTGARSAPQLIPPGSPPLNGRGGTASGLPEVLHPRASSSLMGMFLRGARGTAAAAST